MPSFKPASLASLLCLLLYSDPAFTAPTPEENALSARAGTGAGILNGFLAAEIKPVFGTPPQCCDPYAEDNCRSTSGTAKSGDNWELCFASGGYLWEKDDSTTANCLIDLHYRQGSACISVAGSPCEKIKGTSKILNVQLGGLGGHEQISAAASKALQGASNAMIGQKVYSGADFSPSAGYVTLAQKDRNSYDEEVIVRFGGQDQC